MDLGLRGKVALVTGSSRGIGAAIALELAREGCDVVLAARTEAGLSRTAESIRSMGRRASIQVTDLREETSPRGVIERAISEFGRLDIVVCNAGATKRGDFLELPEADWSDGFALKFTAHRRLLQSAWPHLKRWRGSVILIAGVGGRSPGAEFALGGSVNAALLSLGKALAERGLSEGVRVNMVNPGVIETNRLSMRVHALAVQRGIPESNARLQLAKELGVNSFGTPEDVGRVVTFLASDAARHIVGTTVDIDGGQTKSL